MAEEKDQEDKFTWGDGDLQIKKKGTGPTLKELGEMRERQERVDGAKDALLRPVRPKRSAKPT